MAVSALRISNAGEISNQPDSTGEKLVVYSTSASDNTQTVTVYGTVSSSPDSETFTLDGQVEQYGTKSFTDIDYVELSATAAGDIYVYGDALGSAAVGTIEVASQPSDTETLQIGTTGNLTTYTFKTTVASDGDIKIGSTLAETADNIASALNDASTGPSTPVDLTDWQAASANEFLTATVEGAAVNITDNIPIVRQLAWSFVQAGTDFTISSPTSAVTGTLLVRVNAGDTGVYDAVEFDNADLSATNHFPTAELTSDWLRIGGSLWTLYISSDIDSSDFDWRVEMSNDGSTADYTHNITPSGSGAFSLRFSTSDMVADEDRWEWIRVMVQNNDTTTGATDVRVVYQG